MLAPARTQGCCGAGGRSQAGAVWGFPCTHEISLHTQRSLLAAKRTGLSTQHPAPSTSQELETSTSPGAQRSQSPLCSPPSREYQQQLAPLCPSALSQVVPHNPHLQTPILHFFSLPLTQPLAPGALCLGAEQFAALSCKIPCANANEVNLPPCKREDARDGAKSQRSSSLTDMSG